MGDRAACLAVVVSVGLLVGTDTFGRSESRLLLFRHPIGLGPFLTGRAAREEASGRSATSTASGTGRGSGTP